jgi:hypothetical protein
MVWMGLLSWTGKWGDLSSAEIPGMGCTVTPGDISAGILEFDLVSQSLAVVELPPDLDTKYILKKDTKYMYIDNFCVLRTDNSGVGLAVLTDFRLDMWERKVSCKLAMVLPDGCCRRPLNWKRSLGCLGYREMMRRYMGMMKMVLPFLY